MAEIEDEGCSCSCCGCIVLCVVLFFMGTFGQSCVRNIGNAFERGRQDAITQGYKERSEIEKGQR